MSLVERILSKLFKSVDINKDVDGEKVLYLRRWFICKLPGGRWVYLHKILRSDDDPDPHDHPWDFTTLVLKNGYNDESYDVRWLGGDTLEIEGPFVDRLGFLSFRRRRAEHIHQVKKRNDGPTWTLVLRGPYRREWGFWTDFGRGKQARRTAWVHWRDYLDFRDPDPYDPENRAPVANA